MHVASHYDHFRKFINVRTGESRSACWLQWEWEVRWCVGDERDGVRTNVRTQTGDVTAIERISTPASCSGCVGPGKTETTEERINDEAL